MTPKNYDIDEAPLVVTHKDESGKVETIWAVFDVSRTVEERWIAVCQDTTVRHEILTVFGNIEELLRWLLYRQVTCGDEISSGHYAHVGGDIWLDITASNLGYGDWNGFKEDWGDHLGLRKAQLGE